MNQKTEHILRSLFAIDGAGNVFIRVVTDEPEGDLSNAAKSQSNRSAEDLLASAVVLDDQGNAAVRLAAVPFGMSASEADKSKREKMRKAEQDRQDALQEEQKARDEAFNSPMPEKEDPVKE